MRALNQALIDYQLPLAGLVGFSGGGVASRLTQIALGVHRRYGIFDFNPTYIYGWEGIVNNQDWETYCPEITAALNGNFDNLTTVASPCGQESFDIWGSSNEPAEVSSLYLIPEVQRTYTEQLRGAGGSLTLWLDRQATSHMISQWSASSIVADLVAHL